LSTEHWEEFRVDTRYLRSLKTALSNSASSQLVLICNFEAETCWAKNYVGLPIPAFSASADLVERMEELGILLGGQNDVLLLKHQADPDYRGYLEALGFSLPTTITPDHTAAGRSTTEDVLDSPGLTGRLGELAAAGASLLPMGTSAAEQKLAEATGLPLTVPDASTFERVNSKIFGRRLTEDAGLRMVPGHCCETCEEFAAVLRGYRDRIAEGHRIVVKDAYGVSGKGLVVLDEPAKADRLLRMIMRRAERSGDQRLHVVVEEWLPKQFDLNYQVTIGRDGTSRLDFVKRALTEHGVHKGHIMPEPLGPARHGQVEHAAHAVAKRLYDTGFFGIIGVDAILGADGTLYPVLEINARLNMSTYQGSVTERCQPAGWVALAKYFPLRLRARCTFTELAGALGPLLDPSESGYLVITCFGTVNAQVDNAAADAWGPFDGRLYAVVVAPDRNRLATVDAAAQRALAKLPASEASEEDR
jgi:D-alanine-D-alanine ligase-like ATP-grasp enzyme